MGEEKRAEGLKRENEIERRRANHVEERGWITRGR